MNRIILLLIFIISYQIGLSNDLYNEKNVLKQSCFEENKGQLSGEDASKVNFIYRDNGVTLFLLKTGLAYQFEKYIILKDTIY